MPDATALQQFPIGGDDEIIAFANPTLTGIAEHSRRLLDLFHGQPEVSVVADLATREPRWPGEQAVSWRGNSAIVSALLYPPNPQGPFAVRRATWERVGPLRPVDALLWDWLIRAARAGERIHPVQSDSIDAEGGLPRLTPSRPPQQRDWLLEHLQQFEAATPSPSPNSAVAATALRAGLLLWHDYLDESHRLCQSIEAQGDDRLGDYWHGIMHRREPDYTNAKYWFRHLGAHVLFGDVSAAVDQILKACSAPEAASCRQRLLPNQQWDPFAFIDLCEECAHNEESEPALLARRILLAEMSLLLKLTQSRVAH